MSVSTDSSFADELSTSEKLNLETAVIPWEELQRLYAQGKVIVVDRSLDLVTVASACADNKAAQVQEWMTKELLLPATDNQARQWHQNETELWAVAVAPWVLVQETGE